MTSLYACDCVRLDIHVIRCVCVEFRDAILLRGEECKTREKYNFSENG